jgi:hypothetical protein
MGGGLAFRRKVGGQDHLSDQGILGARQESFERQLRWPQPVKGGESAHEHKIQASIASGLLYYQKVGRTLHYAELGGIAQRVLTGGARRLLGEGITTTAWLKPRERMKQRMAELFGPLPIVLQQMKGQPLGGLRANPW